jgi:hypothetical protein
MLNTTVEFQYKLVVNYPDVHHFNIISAVKTSPCPLSSNVSHPYHHKISINAYHSSLQLINLSSKPVTLG